MNRKRFLIVSRHPPYGESFARETLDVALATAAFDQPVSLLFLGDGVTQLFAMQQGDAIGEKSLEKQLGALPLYDINDIYVDAAALRQFGFSIDNLSLPVRALEDDAMRTLLHESDIVLNF